MCIRDRPRTEYRLTERGKTLIPLLDAVYSWGWHVMKEENLPIDTPVSYTHLYEICVGTGC